MVIVNKVCIYLGKTGLHFKSGLHSNIEGCITPKNACEILAFFGSFCTDFLDF